MIEQLIARQFPYSAPTIHLSGWGNRVVAEQFYAHLVGASDRTVTLLHGSELSDLPDAHGEPQEGSADATLPISEYAGVRVAIDKRLVGRFTLTELPARRPPRSLASLQSTRAVSLLALDTDSTSLVDACWLPLAFALRAGMRVELRGAEGEPVFETRVRLIGGLPSLGRVTFPGLDCGCVGSWACEPVQGANGGVGIGRTSRLSLWVNGKQVMNGSKANEGFRMAVVGGFLRAIRAPANTYQDVDSLPEQGIFTLVLQRQGGPSLRIPLAAWRKVRSPIGVSSRGDDPRSGDGAGVPCDRLRSQVVSR